MGAVSSNSKKRVLLSEINVTPFVDVMLVLLIIFMVTAPMLQQGLNIALPQTSAGGAQLSKEPFILNLKKDGQIYIGEKSIPLNQLSQKLQALFEHRSDKALYLQADKTLPYGLIAKTLGEVKSSGLQNVSLITTVK